MSYNTKFKVSVFILAYNQEKYIAQTIEAILAQNTNFEFNLIIGEDCSTDTTLNIIKEYQKNNPNRIKVITSNKNVGLIQNFIRTIKACDGKYIAICDGDDYWIDQNKLQTQVDFLEANLDYSLVFTDKNDLYTDGNLISPTVTKSDTTTFADLVKGNYIPSVTVLFKNVFYKKDLPNWLEKYPYGDWPVYLMLLKDGGKIKYLKLITANYRKDSGITTSLRKDPSQVIKVNLSILQDIYNDIQFRTNKKEIKLSINQHKMALMKAENKAKHYLSALNILKSLFFEMPTHKLFKQYFRSLLVRK
ncbi:glycosyltransferase [Mesoflavibacter sp. CH_XMU1404-2]|uniref:glycosyltransferase n=1 Tax=Mesoflavibacter sp. CH_XMU1404-2 TaxID=3107766 RepID=UPI003009BD16